MDSSRQRGCERLAEAVIKSALVDLDSKSKLATMRRYRYYACLFFMSEECKDLWCGLAPHMIRDFENAYSKAEKVYADMHLNYRPKNNTT